MSTQLDPVSVDLAKGVQSATGLDYQVVLAQWQAEQSGATSLSNWYHFNPAGITPGDSSVDKLSVGHDNFDYFPSAVAGAQAYALMISQDKNYDGIRQAINTGDPQKELQAIVNSNWDGGHYTNLQKGDKLFAAYNEVSGASLSPTSNPNELTQNGGVSTTDINNSNMSKLREWLGIPANVGWKEIGITVGASILILVLLYRLFTK